MNNEISTLVSDRLISKAVQKAIEQISGMSIWKVVAVNPNQTVNIECCYLDWLQSVIGEVTLANNVGVFGEYATFDPGILVDIPYRVIRHGQFRDMVTPAVGDVGTYTPTYEDMRNWFASGEKIGLASNIKMKRMHGAGVWHGYIQHSKDTQPDYPIDNQTRIIKSNRITVTISDPLDENSQPTGQESVNVKMTGISFTVNADGTILVDAPQANIQVNCATAGVNASTSVKIETPETKITGNLSVGGDATISGKADITGAATIGSTLDVTGIATAAEFKTTGGVGLSTHTHPAGPSGSFPTGPGNG